MSLIVIITTALPLVTALGVLWFTVRNISQLTPMTFSTSTCNTPLITKDDLGTIEGALPNLVRVLVVADKIEKPEGQFAQAVESNFAKRVSYLFLISHRNAASEKGRYYRLFEAYAHMYNSAGEALDIKALPFEWDDYPIIFYQTRDPNGELASIAFRGTELREGIASSYERVPSQYAHTIATSLLADAPSDIKVSDMVGRAEFEKGDSINVAVFSDEREKRKRLGS